MILSYQSHIENAGWTDPVTDGTTSGTTGQSLRLEAIKISILDKGTLDLNLEYQAHVENVGWQPLVHDGEIAGTVGESKRLEAIRINLIGADATKYNILYRVHVQDFGWQVWYQNGQTAGTEGCALRAEAIEIRIVPIQEQIDKIIPASPIIQSIPTENSLAASYSTHVENIGWSNYVYGGIMSGTVGKSLELEAFRVQIINKGALDLGVEYEAHVANTGWLGVVANGATAGTTDQHIQLEAVRLRLTGADASKYSIQYRVHVQNEGWQEYKKDWEIAGTVGLSLRAEAIEIVITPAGISLIREPGQTGGVSTEYCTHIENLAWTGWAKNGKKSGTTGRALRMEAFKLKLTTFENLNIGVTYRSHVENTGWQAWVSDGAVSGTEGQSLRLEALEISLTGTDASNYTIKYRVHIQDSGWTDWFSDGATAGTTGQALRAEAVSIVIIKKADLNANITNEIKNKAPYIQVWGQEYPYPAFLLHDIRTDYRLASSPKVVDGANSVQSLTFDIDPTHEHYNDLHNLRTNIQVYEINSNAEKTQIFEGRVLNNELDFNNVKTVTCEGELSYMLDTTQRPAKYENLAVDEFMTTVLDNHNMSVTADKRIYMGICTVVSTADDALREYKDYKNTFEIIKGMVDSLGGYLVIRHIGGLRFLDYLADFRVVNSQPIEFGKNLLDLKKTEYSNGIITALIPLGAEVGDDADKKKLTISTVNNNCDFIYDESAVNLYGWIFGTMEFDGITDPTVLMQKGYDALHTIVSSVGVSVEVSALDLNQINTDIQKINIGDSVRIISKPHGVDMFLPVSKISRSLQEANDGTITLGGVMPGVTDYVSGTAANMYFGNTAANSVKNIEFITNELMFLVKVTDEKANATQTQLNEAELKITPTAITAAVRSSTEYIADLSNKATVGDLGSLTSRVATAEQKITADAIVSTVTSSATYTNALDGKVSTTNVISCINQTAEAITISASKLNLSGYTTFSAAQSMADAAKSGAITAVNSGLSGGTTTINGGCITTGTINGSNVFVFGMRYNGYISGYTGTSNESPGSYEDFRIGSNGIISMPYKGRIELGQDGLATIRRVSSSNALHLYNNAGDIKLEPSGYLRAQNLYASNQPVNIPMTSSDSSQKITLIRWVGDYVEVSGPAGVKGITVWDSDRKLKANIADSTVNALAEISKIKTRSFNWIKDGSFEGCAFVAQEIEEAIGEKHVLKVRQNDGSISYQIAEKGFIPLLVKAVQELAAAQKENTARLETEIAILKLQIAELKGGTTC